MQQIKTKEEFRDVIGYEGHYMVSNYGRVMSLKRGRKTILNNVSTTKGYEVVSLNLDGSRILRKVHQLVCESFLGMQKESKSRKGSKRMVVNHINFNRSDNRVENLEVVPNRQNTNLKHVESRSKYIGVHWSKYRNRWIARMKVCGHKVYLGCSKIEREAALMYAEGVREWQGLIIDVDA